MLPEPSSPSPEDLARWFGELIAQTKPSRSAAQDTPPSETPPASPAPEEKGRDLFTRLSGFATDLTQLAMDGKLLVAYGRDKEVEDLLHSLASPGPLFPMLVGGPRGGKTTLAHHAVNRIARGECPESLKGACVFETTPSRLLTGLGGPMQWMSRISDFIAELVQTGTALFIRDFHSALGLGMPPNSDGPDLADVLGDLLQSTHPRLMFEARARPLEKVFTEQPALRNLFSPIQVGGLTRDEAMVVIRRAVEDLEIVHEVGVNADACEEALELATRFQVNELLPGSALDLLKDTLATARVGDGASGVGREDVRKRFIQRSGLPKFLVSDEVAYDEDVTREFLSRRVFGQNAAVEAVLRMVALVRTRLNNPLRPMGVFLFLGPTGVGKTELVKALAQFLFGGHERIVRFNMADFDNPYVSVERMFGDPRGDTEAERQGQLTMRLASQPFAVLLLDEFEKATPGIYQRFLQLYDEGLLINGQGEEINLRNTIIVLTSNLGSQLLNPPIGFRVSDPVEEAERAVVKASEDYFRPEFINRMDAVCFFKPLSRHVIRQIAQREVNDVVQREGITRHNLRVTVDDSAIDLLVERGYDLRFGARYLKRQIERSITYPLARQIARKRLTDGATVRLIARNGEIAVGVVDVGEEIGDWRLEIGAERSISNLQSLSVKELRAKLDVLSERIARMLEQHHITEIKARVSEMMERIGQPEFWQRPQEAAAQIEEMNRLSQRVDQAENVQRLFEQSAEALNRASGARTLSTAPSLRAASLHEANQLYRELARELPLAETMLCLRSDEDQAGAFVTVRAVVGANEDPKLHADWARDLTLMYAEWAKARGFQVALINEATSGEGVLEATMNIAGFGAYALLKGEAGSHRLVRQSPKRAGERLSLWALVSVLPDMPAPSGASGESASRGVMLEHRPLREPGALTDKLTRQTTITLGKTSETTGRVLVWRHALPVEEIEQHARRFVSRLSLGTRLRSELALSLSKGQAQDRWLPAPMSRADAEQNKDDVVAIADQVRVYAFYKHPHVKDLRTNVTHTQPKRVLSGHIDEFLLAYLTMSVG